MKNIYYILIIMLSVFFQSCQQESLQKYLVESQEKDNFMTFDFSANTLPFELNENLSEEDSKAFESIKKVNIAFLPNKKATEEELVAERNKLKKILKKSDYKTLMKFNDKRGKGTIYYLGDSEAIQEIVGVVDAKQMGLGVARLLGDDMNPAAIMKMMKNTKLDKDNSSLKSLENIFKNSNFLD